ncbi:hypothetical protein MMC12_004767 [Toensbergia leucococca]|nr:hypothetical protein [Toensbergia leucococca]
MKLCLAFLLGIVLYTFQISGHVLNRSGLILTGRLLKINSPRQDLYDLNPTDELKKRTPIDLASVWASITGESKVGVGAAVGWRLDPNKPAAFTTSQFYGCTVVITVDGKGVTIGYFAEVNSPEYSSQLILVRIDHNQIGSNACISMENQNAIDKQVIPKLLEATDFLDLGSNTQAYIIISQEQGAKSLGYRAISLQLLALDVLARNIKAVPCISSSGTENFPGPRGKAVVTWTPNPARDGAVLKVYIQNDNPIFEQAYDNEGSPVGAAACAGNNKRKRQEACAPPGAAADDSATATATTAAPASATATIQIGSSPVPVGTLTSTALSLAISSAISSLCPPVTQTTTSTTCYETSKVTIPGIAYIDKDAVEGLGGGNLIVQVDSSGYNNTSLLRSLAGMAAMSIASSAAGANCHEETYIREEAKKKRWYSSTDDSTLSLLPFYKRASPIFIEDEKITLCHSGHFAAPLICSP